MSEKEKHGLGTSHESVWSTSTDILERQKSLQKLWLTVTEDVLKRIWENQERQQAFETDIKALLSQNPQNPDEVQRLETMWIKGYWQKVETTYGALTFAEIAKHEKKKEIVDKMNDADFDAFDKWMESRTQTAIRQNEQKLQIEQAAIARWVELDNEIYAKLIALQDRWDTLTEDDKRWLSEIEQRRKNWRPVVATNPK